MPVSNVCVPTLLGKVSVGSRPKGVAAWGDLAYVGVYDGGDVVVVNGSTLTRLGVWDSPGSGANAVAVDATRVYLAHRDSNQVAVFERGSGRLLSLWPTGNLPWGLARVNNLLYVSNYASDTVSILDVDTGRLVREVPVGEKPALLARLGESVYVPLVGSDLVRLTNGGQAVDVIEQVGNGSIGIVADSVRGRLYVSNRDSGLIVVVDDTRSRVMGYIEVPGAPVALALSPNGEWLYAVDPYASRLHIISVEQRLWVGSVPVGYQAGDHGGQGIAVAGERLYVTNYGEGTVSVFALPACAR